MTALISDMLMFSGENPPKLHEIVERLVRNSFKKKKNFFMLIVGPPGSGKSYTALKFAEAVEPDFSPREQIIYVPEQFKEIFENLENSRKRVLIFDEAHVTIPSRRWFSFVNLSINTIMSTFRQVKQLAVFFVAPSQNMIDKQLRSLFEYYCVIHKELIPPGKPYVFGQLYEVGLNYYDLRDQNPYLRKLRIMWNGKIYKVGEMLIEPPSEKLAKEYEEVSLQFKKNVLYEMTVKLIGGGESAKGKGK